ncbi:MAG: hypothetical protein MUF24_03900, partial [Chitinophagaceae bacterium]|nr:hypothetical protein [Chitinophagaceae bacterium]
MKKLLVILLSFSTLCLQAQPLTQVYYGCGGATVVTFPGDLSWNNIDYEFQRQTGITWTTVLIKSGNYREGFHFVLNGELTGPTQFRCIVKNKITFEERISNGVLVDPARFNEAVVPPQPVITYFWGATPAEGNYIEVLPRNIQVSNMRPPFTYKYRKQGDVGDQVIIATTGVFITNVEANVPYIISVEDYCGNIATVNPNPEIRFSLAREQIGSDCSGGKVKVTPFTNTSANINFRRPYTYACQRLPANMLPADITPAFLQSLAYTYTRDTITGLDSGLYVLCARDQFGTLSLPTTLRVNIHPGRPFVISSGPSAPGAYCSEFRLFAGSPAAVGMRRAGTNDPYVFTNGNRINNIPAGYEYEFVVRDECGRVGLPLVERVQSWPPRISFIQSYVVDCFNEVIINGQACTTPLYGIVESGKTDTIWQRSNVIKNLPVKAACYQVLLRDSASNLTVMEERCLDNLLVSTMTSQASACGERTFVDVQPVQGKPPFRFAYSFDGLNYTAPVAANVPGANIYRFERLPPGRYYFKVSDSCGNENNPNDAAVTIGSAFYIKEKQTYSTCLNGRPAGGALHIGIMPDVSFRNIDLAPYTVVIKEAQWLPDSTVLYGKTLDSLQVTDTTFWVYGLPFGKQAGIFITNNCGSPVYPDHYGPNIIKYDLTGGLFTSEVKVNDDPTNCSAIWIEAANLETGQVFEVFRGIDTTGGKLNMQTALRTVSLAGGYYTARIRDLSDADCYREIIYPPIFVASADSTSPGTPIEDEVVLSAYDNRPYSLFSNLQGASPGGFFTGEGLKNLNPLTGTFIPAEQEPRDSGNYYTVFYNVQGKCTNLPEAEFRLIIKSDMANIIDLLPGTLQTDEESAGLRAGCKSFSGTGWQHVFNDRKQLVMSILPGAGNSIQNMCWGARLVDPFFRPARTTSLQGQTVYFAARNFYVEPASVTIGATPVKVRLYYNDRDITPLLAHLQAQGFSGATIHDLRILKKKSGAGSPVNLEVTYDPGAPLNLYETITPTVIPFGDNWIFEFEVTGFSELALIFTQGSALPVTWQRVEGYLKNEAAVIEWTTGTETNTASFTVEHSTNGSQFVGLNTQPAAGNSALPRQYQYIHLQPQAGANYYRIRQTDKDGRSTLSKIIRITAGAAQSKVLLWPNPASSMLMVELPKGSQKPVQIRLLNSVGQVLRQ